MSRSAANRTPEGQSPPSFRLRIAAGFAAAVLLVGATGLISYYALHQTALGERAFSDQARDVIEFGRLKTLIEQKMIAARGFLITGDEQLLPAIEQRHKNLHDLIQQLRKGYLSKKERDLLADIERAEQTHQRATEEAIALRLGGEPAGIFAEKVEPAREALEGRLSAYILHERQILEATDIASTRKTSFASVLILISGLLAVGLTVILAVLLTRRFALLYETERHERRAAETGAVPRLVEGIPGT
jgi:CHASE3 domain sensor protein